MLTQIGQNVCKTVLNGSFCNQAYGTPVGIAILTGTVYIGFNVIKKLYRSEDVTKISNRDIRQLSPDRISNLVKQLRDLFSENSTGSSQREKLTCIQGKEPPFNIAPYVYGPKEQGDLKFCIQLENSNDIMESLKPATPLQIRSALIYFSLKKSSFHQSDAFKEIMIPIIKSARERKINLDCTNGIWTTLSLVCRKIPNDSCTEGQKSVVAALLEENRDPFTRTEEKRLHLVPTMNLDILKLFISHPASTIVSGEDYLEECRKFYPNVYKWFVTERTREAANFWEYIH